MNNKLNALIVVTFIGFLAGGIHLSYGEYKGSGLSRLPMPVVQPLVASRVTLPFIADAAAAEDAVVRAPE